MILSALFFLKWLLAGVEMYVLRMWIEKLKRSIFQFVFKGFATEQILKLIVV